VNSAICALAASLIIALLAPHALQSAMWRAASAPRFAIVIWQLASVCLVGAWVIVGALLVSAPIGLLLSLAVTGRLFWSLVAVWRGESRARRRHVDAVRIVGRSEPRRRFTIIDSDIPAVYCLAGRPGAIVVTSSARAALPDEQLDAALAHERAHLTGRHHLVLIGAKALTRAFPGVALFDVAERQVAHLLEVLADDSAARHHGRRTVAEALVQLACGRAPAVAMPAGGTGALQRVELLLAPTEPLPLRDRLRWLGTLAAVATAPFVCLLLSASFAASPELWCPPLGL